jgi:hypothetical protein
MASPVWPHDMGNYPDSRLGRSRRMHVISSGGRPNGSCRGQKPA